jgi:hypothetical protein
MCSFLSCVGLMLSVLLTCVFACFAFSMDTMDSTCSGHARKQLRVSGTGRRLALTVVLAYKLALAHHGLIMLVYLAGGARIFSHRDST